MKTEPVKETLNLTNGRKRSAAVMESEVGENVLCKTESSLNLELTLGGYRMEQTPQRVNRNAIEQKQLGNREVKVEENVNPSNDKVLALEFIARLQRRSRSFRRLRKIHGVDVKNEPEDICPRRLVKDEVVEDWENEEKVAVNENNGVFVEERRVNALEMLREEHERNKRIVENLNTGKRTVLSWMIDVKTLKSRERVYYMDHKSKQASLGGAVVRDGILCDCCSEVVSISEFEFHSWRQDFSPGLKRSDPLRNICLARGRGLCLLQCMAEAWEKEEESTGNFYNLIPVNGQEKNDDTCILCWEMGDLTCCDGCPSTFHQDCLGIQPNFEYMHFQRVVGTVRTAVANFVGCFVEVLKVLSTFGYRPYAVYARKDVYHISCLQANGGNVALAQDASFCGNGCKEIYEKLGHLLRVKHYMEGGFSWSFLYRSEVDSKALMIDSRLAECNAKLGVALSVLNQSFMPFNEEEIGVDIMRSIIYGCGSNIPRLDFKGFFTAILETDDEVTSVASIRIHGKKLAEMPFAATAFNHREKGMFTRLLQRIESALSFLDIELLLLPAVHQGRQIWVRSFGFEPLDTNTKNMIMGMDLKVFSGTEMLQKRIPKLT
ncbi:unnamed protein product [Sphenostylis stenocarpa]|uniref:Zinc finger PHD-type domain-containing protein n=1 Tax=Sphenostylis stenocarpa TaxID=92480 RepID=A0AA86RRX9_9FABA|nr:unnamed protein product [Sphenostylis stenocarpa]